MKMTCNSSTWISGSADGPWFPDDSASTEYEYEWWNPNTYAYYYQMNCPHCDCLITSCYGFVYCPYCGKRLEPEQFCSRCRQKLPPKVQICTKDDEYEPEPGGEKQIIEKKY
jgi:hypothetical protein